MYNLKKVIASICVIALMLTTVAFGATYSDVTTESAYYEAVETLNKLGIVKGYEDGTYKPEDGVTRAEMAALIARIQGYGDMTAAQTATEFKDVPKEHWASGYVASAASLKIINGYGDGNFGPEDPVLFEQAVKMVMATLGYTPYAEYNGGYPSGYMTAAQRYNVLADVSNATMGSQANRGTIAQLLANVIDTPLMKQARWTTNGEVEYVVCDGLTAGYSYATLMSENLGVVKLRGVVTSNTFTAVDDPSHDFDLAEDAKVEINVMDAFDSTNKDFEKNAQNGNFVGLPPYYLVGETDVDNYLGKSVIAYVTEVDDEWVVLSVAEDTARNDAVEMDLSQFNRIANGKFEYYKTAEAKTATALTLDANVDVVYNNVGGYGTNDIFGSIVAEKGATLNGGKITLIDNNDTKGYDVIFVEVAETVVVDDATDGYVTFKPGSAKFYELEQDEDDTEKVVKVTKDGEDFAIADLVEWDVLSIIAVNDKSDYILAEVISNKIVGAITAQSKSTTSDTGLKYTIGGQKYDVATGAYGIDGTTAVGDGGTFYIDKYGKIAAFDEDAALATGVAANYAYVTAAVVEPDTLTGKNTATVQMVTADGLVGLEMKSTGAKLDGAAFDVDATTNAGFKATVVNKLVKFTKNSSNKITTLDIVRNGVDEVSGDASTRQNLEFDEEDNRFIGTGGFFMDANSNVFFIAYDTTGAVDPDDCYFGSEADLADGEEYTVIANYADKKADDNNIVVVEAIKGKAGAKTGLAVITALGTSENEDAETVFAVEAIMNGTIIAGETTGDVYSAVATKNGADYLTVGDIVKVKVGANDVITAIEVVYDFKEGVRNMAVDPKTPLSDFAVASTMDYAITSIKEEIVGGIVDDYKKSSSLATINGKEYKLSQATNVIVIDANGRDVEIGRGSAANFRYYEALYGNKNVNVDINAKFDDNGNPTDGLWVPGATPAAARQAADYVYVRKYDNKVTDVVIVKGHEDLAIKAN